MRARNKVWQQSVSQRMQEHTAASEGYRGPFALAVHSPRTVSDVCTAARLLRASTVPCSARATSHTSLVDQEKEKAEPTPNNVSFHHKRTRGAPFVPEELVKQSRAVCEVLKLTIQNEPSQHAPPLYSPVTTRGCIRLARGLRIMLLRVSCI